MLFSLMAIGPLIALFTYEEITRKLLIMVIVSVSLMGMFTIRCFKLVLGAYVSYDDKYLYVNYLDLVWYGKTGKIGDPFYRSRSFKKNGHTIKVIKKKVMIDKIKEYIFNEEGNVVIKSSNKDIIIPMDHFNKKKVIKLLKNIIK